MFMRGETGCADSCLSAGLLPLFTATQLPGVFSCRFSLPFPVCCLLQAEHLAIAGKRSRGPQTVSPAPRNTQFSSSLHPSSRAPRSLCSLRFACCCLYSGTPLTPWHPRDWVFHRRMAKFIFCHALYIPHNSASQVLLCMCLVFTIRKTDGENDSPDTLEGRALAQPWQNLDMNSISDPRLYFMHNTPWFLNFLKLLMTEIKEKEVAV